MKKLIATFALAFSAIPAPSDACMSAEDLQRFQANRALAAASNCSDSIATPGSAIGGVFIGMASADAERAKTRAGVDFDVESGKVVRIRHTGTNACINKGWLDPLLVVGSSSNVAPFADCAKTADGKLAVCPFEGVGVTRSPAGIRVEVSLPHRGA